MTVSRAALAQTLRSSPSSSRNIELRASFSPAAATFFSEPRLRRLLAIELQGTASLSPTPAGPLGDQVAWAWVDLPERSTANIETRFASGSVSRRTISIEGLGSDAAARHVAIAVAEMLRSLAHPSRSRKPPAGKSPCCEQLDASLRSMPALAWHGGASSAMVTSEPMLLAGASLGLGLQYQHAGVRLIARWVGGRPHFGTVSWMEAGLAADYRFSFHPSWRLRFGALATAAAVQLGGVRSVEGEPGSHAAWSARAGGTLGVETRVAEATWLSLSVEPAAILRPVAFETGDDSGKVAGAWLGLDLSLQYDRRP